MGYFGIVLCSLILGATVFQNCARTNYAENNPSALAASFGTSRKIIIDPSFNQQKANLKVLFVVDDSYTMSQSQSQLANTLDSLLNPLQGHNVDFKIVSTSGIPGNEVDYTITSRSTAADLVEKTVGVNASARHAALKLFRTSSAAQFTQVKTDVKSAILNVGTGGSDTEEGLCATARQLFDNSDTSFFKPGDKSAIVILSDENDASTFASCVSRYVQRVSTQPVVYYTYNQQRARLTLEYQLVRDGVTTWVPVAWGVGLSGAQSITVGAACASADQLFAINKITAQGYVIRNVSACVYESVPATYYGADLGDNGSVSTKNLCSMAVLYNNVSYANLYAMVNAIGLSAQSGSCVKQILPGNTISAAIEFDSVFKSDAAAASAMNFNLAIKNKASQLFGSSGFTVASLIRRPGESCSLNAGQSYGTSYEALNLVLGPANSVSQSLCNSDFSSTLSQVSTQLVTEANSSYVMALQPNEQIQSVTLVRGGVKTLLSASDYEVAGTTITLSGLTLVAGDTLEIGIAAAN